MADLQLADLNPENLEMDLLFAPHDAQQRQLNQLTLKIWDFCENHGGDHVEIMRYALGAPERFAARAREQDLLAEAPPPPQARPATRSSSPRPATTDSPVKPPHSDLDKPDLQSPLPPSNMPVKHPPQTIEDPDPYSQSKTSKQTKPTSQMQSYKTPAVDTTKLPQQAAEQSPTARKSTTTVEIPQPLKGPVVDEPRTYFSSDDRFKVKKVPGKARVSHPRSRLVENKTADKTTDNTTDKTMAKKTDNKLARKVDKKTDKRADKKTEKKTEKNADTMKKKDGFDMELFKNAKPEDFFKQMFG